MTLQAATPGSPLRTWLRRFAFLLAALVFAPPGAAAQGLASATGKAPALTPESLRPYVAAADAMEPRALPRIGPASPMPSGGASLSPRSGNWASARLVEIPRDTPPGQYSRPRYALGFQSHGLKNLLNSAGFEAQSCLAPVIRLRTKLSSGGDLSGTFWIYARCSFR